MTVTLTSEALGKKPGETYTGPEEAWLLAEGYASQAGYTGPGVSGTGVTTSDVAHDLQLDANREPAPAVHEATGLPYAGPRDPAMGFNDPRNPAYDFDQGGVDTEQPSPNFVLDPASGPAAGGTEVTLVGQNFTGVTGVTFGGVAATKVEVVSDDEITLVVPAHAVGAVDVAVTDNVGTTTDTGAFTYTA